MKMLALVKGGFARANVVVRALAFAAVVALGSVLSPPQLSHATIAFDTTDVLAIVDSATTFITTVGLAVLALLMVAKGIKWARKAG